MNSHARIRHEPGLYSSLTNAQYHAAQGISSSQIKRFLEKTPAKLLYEDVNVERKPNPVYDLGSAVHCLVLEPLNFERDFAVSDVWNLRTNAGKEARDKFCAENKGKTIIDIEQHERAASMANAIISHPTASSLLSDAIVEQSVFWEHKSTNDFKPLLKVRPDAVSPHHPLILDIKTCQNASWSEIQRAILNYKYHVSASMYLEGANQCKPLRDAVCPEGFSGFALICVESEPPYEVACYELSSSFIQIGHRFFVAGLMRYEMAIRDNWPSYPQSLRVIDPPQWADRVSFI